MKKLLITIVAFITIGINVYAQEKSRKELKGDKYAFRYSFDKAIVKYTHAKKLTVEGQRKLAESYHNLNQDTESEKVYSKLLTETDGVLPEDHYNYAMILKINGKYEASGMSMDKFAELKPNDLRAKDYVANKSKLSTLLKDDGKYKINKLDINTDAEDFGPSYYKDQIVFTSSRATPKLVMRNYNWTQKPFWDMYVSELENGQLKKAKLFNKKVNGKLHDGPASFANNGTTMAFTRNNYKDKTKDKVVEIQIHFSNYENGKWSNPTPFVYNNTEYSVGHPCLSEDGNTMYFTSDMPGGFGGSDLYRVSKTGINEWGKVENLGNKINTEGDELFPFIEDNNKILFFASNGRFGLGGVDIFMCGINGSDYGNVYNAGAPLNTQFDDFSAVVDGKTNLGYFSSNRTGGKGNDDIYSFDILKGLDIGKIINGIAKDKNENGVPHTFITLQDEQSKTLDTLTTNFDGEFSFLVDTDKSFKLIGKKETYIDGKNTATTFGETFIVKADLLLLNKEEKKEDKKEEKKETTTVQEPTISHKIKEGNDLGKVLKLNTIFFDLDKSTIRQDAKRELDKIVKIMNKYPSMVVELSSHTDCRASEKYNQELSDKRATASANYIKKRISNPERINGKGYGETQLLNSCACEGEIKSNCVEDDFQQDRRTDFIILKQDTITSK